MLQQLHAARYKGLIALLLDPTSTLPSSSTLPSLRILLKADLVIPDLVNGYLLPSDSLASQLGRAYKAKQNAPKSREFKSSGTLPAVNPEEDLSAIDHPDSVSASAHAILKLFPRESMFPLKQAFLDKLVEDGAERISQAVSRGVTRVSSRDEVLTWAQDHKLDCLVIPFAPIGETADQIDQIFNTFFHLIWL